MSYNLFLDDLRKPADVTWVKLPLGPWTRVRDFCQFCGLIEREGLPDSITFDHDLAAEHYAVGSGPIDYASFKEPTGWHCAMWLVEYCRKRELNLPRYSVHSRSEEGTRNIRRVLSSYEEESSARYLADST